MVVRRRGGGVVVAPDELEVAKAAAVVLVGDLQAELDGIITAQEADPPDDEHDVEGASVGFERARVTALLESAKAGLAALEAAADRVTRGTFGHCEVCGRAIGEERLAAMPAAQRCVACASGPQRRL